MKNNKKNMNTDQIISTSRRTLLKGAAASLGIAAASGLSLNLLTPDSAKAMPPVLPEKMG